MLCSPFSTSPPSTGTICARQTRRKRVRHRPSSNGADEGIPVGDDRQARGVQARARLIGSMTVQGGGKQRGRHFPDPSRVDATKPSKPIQSQRRSPRSRRWMPPQPPNEWQRVDCFGRLVPFPPSGLRATPTTPRQILGSSCFRFQEPWRWLNCNSLASGGYARFPRLLVLEPRATAVPCHAHQTSTVICHRETADWT
jgi:hypothetical protein